MFLTYSVVNICNCGSTLFMYDVVLFVNKLLCYRWLNQIKKPIQIMSLVFENRCFLLRHEKMKWLLRFISSYT